MSLIKKFQKKAKAYIGAIGDDLPSLIPIFIGLTLFFSVFLTTYNVYKDNTDLYSLENEVLQIGLNLRQDSLIASYKQFTETCNKVNTHIKWNAFVVDTDLNAQKYQGLSKVNLSDDNLSAEVDPSDPSDNNYFRCFELDEYKDTKEDTRVYFYPITIQKKEWSQPAKIYVVGWE